MLSPKFQSRAHREPHPPWPQSGGHSPFASATLQQGQSTEQAHGQPSAATERENAHMKARPQHADQPQAQHSSRAHLSNAHMEVPAGLHQQSSASSAGLQLPSAVYTLCGVPGHLRTVNLLPAAQMLQQLPRSRSPLDAVQCCGAAQAALVQAVQPSRPTSQSVDDRGRLPEPNWRTEQRQCPYDIDPQAVSAHGQPPSKSIQEHCAAVTNPDAVSSSHTLAPTSSDALGANTKHGAEAPSVVHVWQMSTDMLLPLFIAALVLGQVPQLHASLAFMQRYHRHGDWAGKTGFLVRN